MRALAYRGPDSLVLEERPCPRPREGEVLVHVDACSICGTDLRIAAGSHRSYADRSGRVPGHEIAGTVAETGGGVETSVGESVFVAPNYGCGQCRACLRGQVNLCDEPRAVGITEDGGFAEYVLLRRDLVDQGNLLGIGGGADPAAVALAEPLACALRGSRACRIGEGDVVLVYGAGPIGLFHVALARLAGASAVVVCEPNLDRRRRALAWGATSVNDTGFEELRAALGAAGAARGADAVVVAAPVATAQVQALELAAPQGRVNFFAGLARDRSRVGLDSNLIHYKELLVTGTTASTNDECRAALDLIVGGQVDVGSLIDARFDLASARDAFALAGSGRALKVVIEP
ncbi:MAG: alcohol dehydrogenase catalytic domain-containing protein [Acidimicrobiales bacterium]|jgi:L-iditol 2-dehydrogenase